MPIIPALRGLRQKDYHKSEASLGYIMNSRSTVTLFQNTKRQNLRP